MKKIYAVLLLSVTALSALAQGSAVVRLSVANVRLSGEFSAEMVTQALLGTPVKVLNAGKWNEVELPDGYRGWVHEEAISILADEDFASWCQRANQIKR